MNTREKMLILLARRPMATFEIAETLGICKVFALDGLLHLQNEGAIFAGEPEKVDWSTNRVRRWHLNLDCIKPSAREVLGPLFCILQKESCTKTQLVLKSGLHTNSVGARIARARKLGGMIYISGYFVRGTLAPIYALGDGKDADRPITKHPLQNVWR